MDTGEPGPEQSIGRRQLIVGAAALAALAACGSSDNGTAGSTTTTRGLGPTTTRHGARLSGDPFTLGVASGDPLPGSVILWTRLAPDALAEDGAGGMPAEPVDVIWEVAADDRFTQVVSRGVATAMPEDGHSVHVDAGGLDPAGTYHYRFTVADWTSPVARTRTLPEGTPERFALGVANCQWIDTGRYAAYRDMAEADLDLILHLGDYIYEYPGDRSPPARIPTTLEDYRLRYAAYHLDEQLQAAHARFPFVCTWDDHEVNNNYAGDTSPTVPSADEVRAIKAAAYRGWWENLPVRLDPPDGSDLAVYRHLDIGDLARVYILDQRQDADVPPCRDAGVEGDFGDCEDRTSEDRSNMGAEQEAWFAETTAASTATWNLIGNPVVLAGVDAGTGDESAFYLDTWDGYPQGRLRYIEALAGTDNPVVLTGDYHAGMVLDVHRTPFDPDSEVVATELMSPPISSPLFSDDVSARTPQLRQQINAHGWLQVEVAPGEVVATFRTVDDIADADSPVRTEATWAIEAGTPRAVQR